MRSDDNERPRLNDEEGARQQLIRIRAEIERLLSDPRTSEQDRQELRNDHLFAAILGEKL